MVYLMKNSENVSIEKKLSQDEAMSGQGSTVGGYCNRRELLEKNAKRL